MKILAIPGSYRTASWNRKLLAIAAAAAETRGANVERLDLRDLALPVYDGDIEAVGLPESALEFKRRISAADGLLIASPEYNHSIPGPLKNAIDWASRPPENPFKGKTAALMSASTSGFGGVRSLMTLRVILSALGVWIVPSSVSVSRAAEAFNADGSLKDEKIGRQVDGLVRDLLEALR